MGIEYNYIHDSQNESSPLVLLGTHTVTDGTIWVPNGSLILYSATHMVADGGAIWHLHVWH